MSKVVRIKNILQEFSLPLIFGVIAGLLVANWKIDLYHHLIDYELFGEGASFLGHKLTPHFLINDIFMVFFFGIAAKEITESVLPGGALNPPSKAINPLLGTIGGVVGPVVVFFILSALFFTDLVPLLGEGISAEGVSVSDGITRALTPGEKFSNTEPMVVFRGWGIPTATDIALAWLVARMVFGATHPAVNFLLLLAVADDAIGLGIIAVFYPDPAHPPAPQWLGLMLLGMLVVWALRKRGVQTWTTYIVFGGVLSWLGLLLAHLHPALALVPIVPFLPGPTHDHGLFSNEEAIDPSEAAQAEAEGDIVRHVEEGEGHGHHEAHSPLEEFEHQLKSFVDFGLFFFAFANAGVELGKINMITWLILASLLIGKVIGITIFSYGGKLCGFPLPEGMSFRHLIVAGVVAGLGLTVALFVTGEAYPGDNLLQGPAKMGAVFSAGAALLAFILGRVLGVTPRKK